jgi:hypothetical protein
MLLHWQNEGMMRTISLCGNSSRIRVVFLLSFVIFARYDRRLLGPSSKGSMISIRSSVYRAVSSLYADNSETQGKLHTLSEIGSGGLSMKFVRLFEYEGD